MYLQQVRLPARGGGGFLAAAAAAMEAAWVPTTLPSASHVLGSAAAQHWRSIGSTSSSSSCCWIGGQQQHPQSSSRSSTSAWPHHHRSFAAGSPSSSQPSGTAAAASSPSAAARSRQPPRLVVYRGKWLTPVRYAVRAKVAQLMAAGGVAAGLAGLAGGGGQSLLDTLALAGVVTGSIGGSLALYYYGRRYVGELSLLEPRRETLRFSVLDFWGNREDVDVPLAALTPPLRGVSPKAAAELAAQLLFPVNVAVPRRGRGGGGSGGGGSGGGGGEASSTERRQFYLSLVAGVLHEPRVFMELLKGEYVPPPPASSSSSEKDSEEFA